MSKILIGNQGSYLLSLNKNEKKLLNELKLILNNAKSFLQSNYLTSTDGFEDICAIIFSSGYEFFFKINSIIEILHTIETTQTNKFKYEECFRFMIDLIKFSNLFYGISYDKNEHYMQKELDLSKIINNIGNENVSQYQKHFDLKITMLDIEKISIINNNINHYILQLVKINIIIGTIDI